MRAEIEDWKMKERKSVFRNNPLILNAFAQHGLFDNDEAMRMLDILIAGGVFAYSETPDDQLGYSLAYHFDRFVKEPEYFTHCYSLMNFALDAGRQECAFAYLCEHDQLQELDQHYFYLIMLQLDTQSLLTHESFEYCFYYLTSCLKEFLQELFDAFFDKSLSDVFSPVIQFGEFSYAILEHFSKILLIYKQLSLLTTDDMVRCFEKFNLILSANNLQGIYNELERWRTDIINIVSRSASMFSLFPRPSDSHVSRVTVEPDSSVDATLPRSPASPCAVQEIK